MSSLGLSLLQSLMKSNKSGRGVIETVGSCLDHVTRGKTEGPSWSSEERLRRIQVLLSINQMGAIEKMGPDFSQRCTVKGQRMTEKLQEGKF